MAEASRRVASTDQSLILRSSKLENREEAILRSEEQLRANTDHILSEAEQRADRLVSDAEARADDIRRNADTAAAQAIELQKQVEQKVKLFVGVVFNYDAFVVFSSAVFCGMSI